MAIRPYLMKEFSALEAFLATPKKISITTHANPDADALGSSLGFYHFLKQRGHTVSVISPTDYPEFLNWMPGQADVIINNDKTATEVKELFHQADLICCLDFSGLSRIRKLGDVVKEAPGKKLLVDHHLNPEDFADFKVWDNKASATAELIYDIIIALNGRDEITREIAECLYAGIMTDTGSFRHSSTSAKVHRTVADLMECGADVNKVSRLIYDTNTLNRLRFTGYALMEKLTVHENKQIAYFVITAEEHERFHLKSGDTEGLVNYALSIKGIQVAAIIMEKDGEVKMSFRSIGNYSVNDFASDHFSGGGHRNAAGGLSDLNLEDTVAKFKDLIPTFATKYNRSTP